MNQKQFHEKLSEMPALHHTLPGEKFDLDKSEVVAWVMALPGFKNWLFNRVTATERVEYDGATGKWSGVRRGPVGRPPTGSGQNNIPS